MSDFLNNLIRRHEQPKAALRPRLPSLFETADTAGVSSRVPENAIVERDIETDAPVTPPEPRRRNTASPASKPVSAIVEDRPDPQPAFTSAREPSPVLPNTPSRARDESVDEEPSHFAAPPRETPRAAPAKPAVVAETPDTPSPIPPPVATRAVQSVEAIKEPAIAEIVTVTPRRPDENATPRAPESAIRAMPQPPLPEPPRSSPFEMPRVPPPQPTYGETRRAAHEVPREEAEPVIHVSIGRIEIRASEERETRARKSEAPSAVMTLDAYLKSRAKR